MDAPSAATREVFSEVQNVLGVLSRPNHRPLLKKEFPPSLLTDPSVKAFAVAEYGTEIPQRLIEHIARTRPAGLSDRAIDLMQFLRANPDKHRVATGGKHGRGETKQAGGVKKRHKYLQKGRSGLAIGGREVLPKPVTRRPIQIEAYTNYQHMTVDELFKTGLPATLCPKCKTILPDGTLHHVGCTTKLCDVVYVCMWCRTQLPRNPEMDRHTAECKRVCNKTELENTVKAMEAKGVRLLQALPVVRDTAVRVRHRRNPPREPEPEPERKALVVPPGPIQHEPAEPMDDTNTEPDRITVFESRFCELRQKMKMCTECMLPDNGPIDTSVIDAGAYGGFMADAGVHECIYHLSPEEKSEWMEEQGHCGVCGLEKTAGHVCDVKWIVY